MNQKVNKWRILPKLALTGVVKNGAVYYPYICAGIFSVFTFFVFSSILHNDIIATLPKSAYAWALLQIGRVLLGIILLPFLFYTNSFLMKRRKKEIGLYSILGLEKKHISYMMLVESLFSFFLVMAGGIISGAVLSKLLFLLLLRMTRLPIDVEFTFYPAALLETLVFFFWVFAISLIYNLIEVGKSKPVELLSGSKRGEKEPRFLWLYSIFGFGILLWGYFIAVTARIDSDIFMNFFLAVFLVVIGTYFLFTSGSVAFLKVLKKNNKVYYRPENFITISGMLYRMKKNAASLVNICIFSTMVIITLVCTTSLYFGLDEIVYFDYPYDIDASFVSTQINENEVLSGIASLEEKYAVKTEGMVTYDTMSLSCGKTDNSFHMEFGDRADREDNYIVRIIALDDYNKLEDKNAILGDDEVFIFSSGSNYSYPTLKFMNEEFLVKEEIKEMRIAPKSERNVFLQEYYIVVKDKEMHDKCVAAWAIENGVEDIEGFTNSDYRNIRLNVVGNEADRIAFINEFGQWCQTQTGFSAYDNNIEEREKIMSMNGGLLFIGLLFSLVFLMCLLLIMYYKQISEGYEDRDGFAIMQQVGMSDKEIKGTIHRQILLVFFLPILGAILHTIAGLFMVSQLFAALRFFNNNIIICCAIAVNLIFIVFYGASYMMTAKTYYGIIKQRG